MTPERWQHIESLFARCVALAGEARQDLLDRECRADPELHATVQGMLEADAVVGDATDDPLKVLIGNCAEEVAAQVGDAWHGRMLGAYRIERELGAGGMGTVFLARRADEAYERLVAIKVLGNAFASSQVRGRFLAERQILADLAHPNIAQLLDGGTTAEGVPYLVMEYIEGVSIERYCEDRQLTIEERLRLFLRVCSAVHYAHQRLVIHRDIKPGNILVTSDGTPKLLDFGIAKLLGTNVSAGDPAMTQLGSRLLTPRHASPEQIRGEGVTTASDVYSMGVLLYRLLAGRYPHEGRGTSASDLEREILEAEPVRPSVAAPHLGALLAGDLDNIVLKALQKDPERRYATIPELARDIECHLTHLPVAARPEGAGYRLRKFVRRHRAGVATAAGVTLLVAALAGFYTLRLAQERDALARERAAAEAVSQFMVEIFKGANPWTGEENVSARELLDRAYEGIAAEAEAHPLLAAKMMVAMGRAYGGLAQHDRAVELEREALALRRASLRGDHPDVGEALHYLGVAQSDRGDYPAARASLGEALAIRERHAGRAALPVGETLKSLAFVHMRESDYPAMQAALDRALDIHLEAVGPRDRRTADVLALLGSYYWLVGQFPESQSQTQRALAIEEGYAQPDKLRLAAFIHSLGLMAWQLGNYPRAIELYERELALREQRLGPEHPTVALALYGLGSAHSNLGRYTESFPYFQRAAALQEDVLGPDSHYLAMTLGGYGFAQLGALEYAEARATLTRSLAIFEAHFGPQHPDLRAPLAGLAKVAVAERRFAEAHRLLERARGIVEAKLAADHPDVLRTRVSIGDVYRAEGRHETAVTYYEPAVEAFARTLGLGHPFARPALCGLVDSLVHLQLNERAEGVRQRAKAAGQEECETGRGSARSMPPVVQ